MKVYLAGPVNRTEDGGVGWRNDLKEADGHSGIEWLDPVEEIGREKAKSMMPKEVVANDKGMIDVADAVLVGHVEVLSVGTWREVEYALSICNIPVSIWTEPADEIDGDLSPWMHEAGYVGDDIGQCLQYLIDRNENRKRKPVLQLDIQAAFLTFDALETMIIRAVNKHEIELGAEFTEILFMYQSQLPKVTDAYFNETADTEKDDHVARAIRDVGDWAEENDHSVKSWFDNMEEIQHG